MEIFLVGGAVRDQKLKFPYNENDWVVVGATPDDLIALGYKPVGKDFPVFLHPETHEEYALARTERKVSPGYKGFTFHTAPDVSLEQDLERRDLTINAMAQDSNGLLIDPYGGEHDLRQRLLRHVSDAFREDPVRVLRVARFMARYYHLGFHLAPETQVLIHQMVDAGETQHLVIERVWQELVKALSEKNPEQFIITLSETEAIKDIVPELCDDYLKKSIQALTHVSQRTENTLIRFASMIFPLKQNQQVLLLNRLSPPKEYRDLSELLETYYSIFIDNGWSTKSLYQLFKGVDVLRRPERLEVLLQTCELIATANGENKSMASQKHKQLLEASLAFKNINPQELIEQGLEKSQLGEAIEEKRRKNLDQWIKSLNRS